MCVCIIRSEKSVTMISPSTAQGPLVSRHKHSSCRNSHLVVQTAFGHLGTDYHMDKAIEIQAYTLRSTPLAIHTGETKTHFIDGRNNDKLHEIFTMTQVMYHHLSTN